MEDEKKPCRVLRQPIHSLDMRMCVWAKLVQPVFRPTNGSSSFPCEALADESGAIAFIPSSPCFFRPTFKPIEERHAHHQGGIEFEDRYAFPFRRGPVMHTSFIVVGAHARWVGHEWHALE